MPHLIIHYTGQLDQEVDMPAVCRAMAQTLRGVRDEHHEPVFPTGGIRVLAYPAPHYALADGGEAGLAASGRSDYAFMYLNLRMGKGRSELTQQRAGEAISQTIQTLMADLGRSKARAIIDELADDELHALMTNLGGHDIETMIDENWLRICHKDDE